MFQSRRANVFDTLQSDDRDIPKKLELDRENCKDLGRERPEMVYDAFNRYKKESRRLLLSDMGLLAELFVLAKIVGVDGLAELAMERLWELTPDAKGLNSVLLVLSHEEPSNADRLETWVGDLLKKEGVVDDLSRLADFRANLQNDEMFWSYMVMLGFKTTKVSERLEFVRAFWV